MHHEDAETEGPGDCYHGNGLNKTSGGARMSDTPRSRETSEPQRTGGSPGTPLERTDQDAPGPQVGAVTHVPETVDDFLRNFLRRSGLTRTLSRFQTEWYGSVRTRTPAGVLFVPDAVTHGRLLRRELDSVRAETDRLRQEVRATAESLVRTQRERGLHRLQARRAAQQKDALMEDFRRLKEHLEAHEPVLRQLDDKFHAALRQKTLLGLQKDRVLSGAPPGLDPERSTAKKEQRKTRSDKPAAKSPQLTDPEFPVCKSPPCADVAPEEGKTCTSFRLLSSIKAHELPVSCVAPHPHRPVLASASDDRSWRLWEMRAPGQKVGQMLLTGEGHSDWLSACSFNPDGSKLATTSGDATVRLWDWSLGSCVWTLSGHSQPTWGCSFRPCGRVLASCSADGTARLWDLSSRRCSLTLRQHAASVSSVSFLPCSDLLLTCSSDRTVVLWDARLGLRSTTLRGHRFPCNHAAFSPAAHAVASCDSQGVVHLWDPRKPSSPRAAVDAGPLAANQVAFNESGKLLAVASSDGLVRLVDVESCTVDKLAGHSGGVQSVTFDPKGGTLMSAGNDGLINVWS